MLLAFLAVPLGMRGQTATLVSGSGTSGYTVPDGWTTSGTVEGGSYLKFDNGTMTSPEFAPHNGLSFAYSVATFGSGDNHPLTIRILNASTDAVISEMTTATPTSSSYITTGSPLSLGDVTVAFKIQMYGPTGKGVRLRNYSITGTPAGGSTLEDNDLALTGAPIALTFDLYDNDEDQVINYTTSSTGTVSVADNAYVTAEVDQTNKKITVTPVAVTNGTQTITVNQLADDDYKAGSVTFTVNITDNTPFNGVIFNASTDSGTSPIVKDNVSLACSNGVLNNGSEYRFYKNSTTTISTNDGSNITKIEFTGVSGNPASGFGSQAGWSTSGNDGVWEGQAESVSFTASGAQVRATVVRVTVAPNTNPSINAEDMNISYNATSGSIAYSINNEPDPAGTLTAAINGTSTIAGFNLGTVTASAVPFACDANDGVAARTATVTLTYSYGNPINTVTKNVTITQEGNPDAFNNISDISEVGTAYTVKGTVVATNDRGFVIGDGTGYVYYYKGENTGKSIGDKVKVSGTTGTYGHIIQFPAAATVTEATESSYTAGTPAVTSITSVPDYSTGYHLSTYLEFEGVLSESSNKYFITLGSEQIQVSYPTSAQVTTLTAVIDKMAHVKGYFTGINSDNKFTIMLESVEEVFTPTIIVSTNSVDVPADGGSGTINVTYNNITTVSSEVWFCNAAGNDDAIYSWVAADINSSNNVEYLVEENDGAARTAYFKVWAYDDDLNPVYSELITITQEEAPVLGGTINFGSAIGSTKIDDTSVTGNDSYGNTWTITTVFEGESSFTQNASYSQVGASSKPASTITFTTTLPRKVHIKKFSAKFGGFSGTAGDISLKVGTTEIGSGSLSGTADVVAENTTDEIGTVLTVTVTNISKGVKCYYISYAFDEVLSITGITSTSNGWYLIAPPVLSIKPTVGNGILSPDYDLYYFDQTGGGVSGDGKEWRNYKQNSFNLVSGKGYLYANSADVDLVFSGTPYSGNGQVTLTKAGSGDFDGYNLIGNPYNTSAAVDKEFYRMNDTHDGIIVDPVASGGTVDAMEGIFVIATSNGETVTFSQSVSSPAPSNQLVMNLSRNTRGSATIDRAIVRFGEGQMLPKFMLNPDNTKLYIPQGNKDYAVVRSEARGEMPVNFKAAENGTYTISVEAENLDVNYLHLIDNITGMDVDLLATPSYTFEARKSDIASRFRLVFDANTGNDETNDNFAFINNGELIVNGTGTVQVIDILGRQMFSHEVNSSFRIQNSSFAPGVYVLRLANGNDVKTQKIVIK